MQRKVLFLLLILLPAFAAAAVLLLRRPPEPTYAGRSLEIWVSAFRFKGDPESKKAITLIISNCLPSLVQQLKYDPRPRLARMTAIAKVLPRSLLINRPRLANYIYHDHEDIRAHIACMALCIAGPAAMAAVPDLKQIAIKTNCPASTRAIQALIMIDYDPAPTLAAIILNPDHPGRLDALRWGETPRITTGLIERLVSAVTNSNEKIACIAVDAVGDLARRNASSSAIDVFVQGTELLVLTLQRAARDPREPVSQAAKDALKLLSSERLKHLPRI